MDTCVPRGFSARLFADFWCAGSRLASSLLEIEVNLSAAFQDEARSNALAEGLVALIPAAANLRILRLGGCLRLGDIASGIQAQLLSLSHLASVYVANGNEATWGVHGFVRAMACLPVLHQLEVRFARWAPHPTLAATSGLAMASKLHRQRCCLAAQRSPSHMPWCRPLL